MKGAGRDCKLAKDLKLKFEGKGNIIFNWKH